MPDSINSCGVWNAGCDDHLAPRANLLRFLALPELDADRALALEQYTGGVGVRLDP